MDAAEVKAQLSQLVGLVTSIDKNLALQSQSAKAEVTRVDKLEEKLKPISDHVAMMNGAAKFIAWAFLACGAGAALVGIVVAFAKH